MLSSPDRAARNDGRPHKPCGMRCPAKTFGGETTTRAVPAKPWVVDDYLGHYTTKVYNIIEYNRYSNYSIKTIDSAILDLPIYEFRGL